MSKQLVVIVICLLSLSNSENEKKEKPLVMKISPHFYLSPFTNTSTIIQNKSKLDWLTKYKFSTTATFGNSSFFFSEIQILLLAQQMSVVRPRILKLSFTTKKDKILKLYYRNEKKPQINPILLRVQNNNNNNRPTLLLNLDKSRDLNYKEKVIDNKTTTKREKQYITMKNKKPKIRLFILIGQCYQYEINIYLTTSTHQFEYSQLQ